METLARSVIPTGCCATAHTCCLGTWWSVSEGVRLELSLVLAMLHTSKIAKELVNFAKSSQWRNHGMLSYYPTLRSTLRRRPNTLDVASSLMKECSSRAPRSLRRVSRASAAPSTRAGRTARKAWVRGGDGSACDSRCCVATTWTESTQGCVL